MHLSVQQMTSLPVLVLVLGIGIARHQSIGYWVLGAKLGIVLTLHITVKPLNLAAVKVGDLACKIILAPFILAN